MERGRFFFNRGRALKDIEIVLIVNGGNTNYIGDLRENIKYTIVL
jgi:hypothetical protein